MTPPPGFNAVVTTGIYCRAGCSGRPHPENVRRFDLAAAAEAAGFRACHLCRPYRTSEPAAWLAGPDLVCRAIRSVVDGGLDDGTEDQLGARLGVSGRHLRRLFLDHVGTTPAQLARSRRAHFARRLLDDTDLPVAQVAFAAGFGSVRQLNRTMRDVFRAPPQELRDRRRRADRLVADGGLVLRLQFAGPIDWPAMLSFFAPRAIPGVESVAGHTYRRTITVAGDAGVIEVEPDRDGELLLRVHLPRWEDLIHQVQRVRRLFDLDADLPEVNRVLRRDPIVGSMLRARPGLRLPGAWDPFEVGVRAIVGQQVSVGAATTIIGRIVARLGQPVGGLSQLGLDRTFPSVDAVAGADLARLGLTRARADAVRTFAQAVAERRVPLDGSVPVDDLVAALVALPGIGDWTAHYLALRLGETDAFPAGDLGLRRALALDGALPTRAALERMAHAWRPWRAYAAIHLWSATGAARQGAKR